MSLFGFGRRRRSRRGSKRSKRSRRSRRGSKRSRRSSSKHERVGNKLKIVGKGGKVKSFKIRKTEHGLEYYVSGKRKTKHFLGGVKKHSRRKHRRSRKFGYMKDSLLDIMGNFQPSAEMSLAQSTTGLSAPQMISHMNDISLNNRSNFYTNV